MKKLLLALLVAFAPQAFAQGVIAPFPFHTFFDNSGNPCNGCKLFAYVSGTTTKQNTYTSEDLGTAQANPIVMNSTGRPTSPIFLDALSYKFVLAPSTDTDPPVSPLWTVDEVSAPASFNISLDIAGTAGESLTALDAVYLSDGSGALTAGRWYKSDADNAYSSTTANGLGVVLANASAADTISVRIVGRVTGLAGLSSGSLYYLSATAGAITSSAPANARAFAMADTTSSIVLSQWIPVPDASTTVAGKVSTGTQSFAGAKTFTGALTTNSTFTANGAGDFDSTLNVDGVASLNSHPQFEPGTSTGTYAQVQGRFYTNTTAVGNVGAGEDDLMSTTVPADTLSADGRTITLKASFSIANNANAKTIKFYWNAVAVLTFIIPNLSIATPAYFVAEITRTGSNTQRLAGYMVHSSGGGAGAHYSLTLDTTGAATDTAGIAIKFTGTATTNDDISQDLMILFAS